METQQLLGLLRAWGENKDAASVGALSAFLASATVAISPPADMAAVEGAGAAAAAVAPPAVAPEVVVLSSDDDNDEVVEVSKMEEADDEFFAG